MPKGGVTYTLPCLNKTHGQLNSHLLFFSPTWWFRFVSHLISEARKIRSQQEQRAAVKTDSHQQILFRPPPPTTMNISLENPYGDVTIPRAKLRDQADSSTIIMNPMALESTYNNRNSASNPYNSFKTPGENNTSGVPVYGEARNGQNPPPYNNQPGYTVKESDEQVSRCYACCCRCRRRK